MFKTPGIFICGYPKSGTTLLLSLFDGHSELLVFPEEIQYFSRVYRVRGKYNKIRKILNDTGANDPSMRYHDNPSGYMEYSNIDNKKYINDLKKLLNKSNGNDKDLYSKIFENWKLHTMSNKNIKYFVEKTPKNEFYTNLLDNWFPNSKFVYVVRDPRDNYLSYNKKKPNLKIEHFVEIWKESTSLMLANIKKSSDNFIIIKYEDLVANPTRILNKLSKFMNIKFEKNLLHPTRNGNEWMGNSMFDVKQNEIFDNSINRWKDKLSEEDIKYLESFLRTEMDYFKYKRLFNFNKKRNLTFTYVFKRFIRETIYKSNFTPELNIFEQLRNEYRFSMLGITYRYLKNIFFKSIKNK